MNSDIKRQIEEKLDGMLSELNFVANCINNCIDDLRMVADGPQNMNGKDASMHQIANRPAQIVGRED